MTDSRRAIQAALAAPTPEPLATCVDCGGNDHPSGHPWHSCGVLLRCNQPAKHDGPHAPRYADGFVEGSRFHRAYEAASPPPEPLDVAWKAAEDAATALGYSWISLDGRFRDECQAGAFGAPLSGPDGVSVTGPTPAAALVALAARLSEGS